MLSEVSKISMKLRPAMQLRFYDVEQYERIKANAAAAKISINEYVLCAIGFAEMEASKRKSQENIDGR
jgi:hypothetical protein